MIFIQLEGTQEAPKSVVNHNQKAYKFRESKFLPEDLKNTPQELQFDTQFEWNRWELACGQNDFNFSSLVPQIVTILPLIGVAQ